MAKVLQCRFDLDTVGFGAVIIDRDGMFPCCAIIGGLFVEGQLLLSGFIISTTDEIGGQIDL